MGNLDYQIFQWINQFAGKQPILDEGVLLFTKYMGLGLIALFLLLLWFSKKGDQQENRKTVLLAVLVTLLALGINQIIGTFYFRPRPFAHHVVNLLVDKSIDPSFPSDHATVGFSLAFSVWLRNRKFGYGFSTVALLLAGSRIFVGTHYPLDVLGGAGTSILAILLVKSQEKWLQPVMGWLIGQYRKVEVRVFSKGM